MSYEWCMNALQAGVVKEIVACHAEALADAALEMVSSRLFGVLGIYA